MTKLEVFFGFIKEQYNFNRAEKSKGSKLTFLLPLIIGKANIILAVSLKDEKQHV